MITLPKQVKIITTDSSNSVIYNFSTDIVNYSSNGKIFTLVLNTKIIQMIVLELFLGTHKFNNIIRTYVTIAFDYLS